jgi:hypothetical protein
VADKDIDEKYTVHSDYQTIVADVKKFSQGGKTAGGRPSTATQRAFLQGNWATPA